MLGTRFCLLWQFAKGMYQTRAKTPMEMAGGGGRLWRAAIVRPGRATAGDRGVAASGGG
jgi:hypothetical protein